jgi:hypothetical protein
MHGNMNVKYIDVSEQSAAYILSVRLRQPCQLSCRFKSDLVVYNIFNEVGQSKTLVWKRS